MFLNEREPPTRVNNNHKTTFSLADPTPVQKYDYTTQGVRQRQFVEKPLQPAATRQSYQDSDIFGTKTGTEIVQKSALVEKQIKVRENATYGKTDILSTSDARNGTANSNQAVTRNEKNWQSSVFAGP
jgi:hypothetical protein